MSDNPENIAEPLQTIDVPIAPLSYETSSRHPMSPVLQAVGFCCVLLAVIGFALLSLSVFTMKMRFAAVPQSNLRLYMIISGIGTLVTVGLYVVQIVAGVAAMRLRPTALPMLRFWAWLTISCQLLFVAVYVYVPLHFSPTRFGFVQIANFVSYYIEHLGSGLGVPILILIILRSRTFADAVIRQT